MKKKFCITCYFRISVVFRVWTSKKCDDGPVDMKLVMNLFRIVENLWEELRVLIFVTSIIIIEYKTQNDS